MPIVVGRHKAGRIPDEDLVDFMREISVRFNSHQDKIRSQVQEAIATRRGMQLEALKSQFLHSSALPRKDETLLDWRRRTSEPGPGYSATPRSTSAPDTPFPSALALQRKSKSLQGGRPQITIEEVVAYRHLHFALGVSGQKLPAVVMGAGMILGGDLPDPKLVATSTALRSHEIRLGLVDNMVKAEAVNTMLVKYPYIGVSFNYDATIEGTNSQANLFVKAPVEESLKYVDPESIFVSFTIVPSKTSQSMAAMTVSRLRDWSSLVEGLFLRLNMAYVWSVVDHAALPEAKRLAELLNGELVKDLKDRGETLSDYNCYLPPRLFKVDETIIIFLARKKGLTVFDASGKMVLTLSDKFIIRVEAYVLLGNTKPDVPEGEELPDPTTWPEPNDPTIRVLKRSQGGDALHKDALVCGSIQTNSFGNTRGSAGKPVVHTDTAMALGINYYQKKGDQRFAVRVRMGRFMGRRDSEGKLVDKEIPMLGSIVSQRWQFTAHCYHSFRGGLKLESDLYPGRFLYPHFLLDEMPLYTPSQYQHAMLGQAAAGAYDPRIALVRINLPIDVNDLFWEPANAQSRGRSEHGLNQGFDMRGRVMMVHTKLAPFLERTDLRILAPSTMQGVDDLRNYAVWFEIEVPYPAVPYMYPTIHVPTVPYPILT